MKINQFFKRFAKTPKYLALILLFLLVSIIPCLITNYVYWVKANRERQMVSEKVLAVMRTYNCNNREIYEAIMATFDPVLVAVVIAVESEYRIDAVSQAGCRGLMQLSPDKLSDWKNVRKNIKIGSAYLEEQLKRFGDLELAFAAYNAGPETVLRYQGVPPYPETLEYIEKAKRFGLAFNDVICYKTSKISNQRRPGAVL